MNYEQKNPDLSFKETIKPGSDIRFSDEESDNEPVENIVLVVEHGLGRASALSWLSIDLELLSGRKVNIGGYNIEGDEIVTFTGIVPKEYSLAAQVLTEIKKYFENRQPEWDRLQKAIKNE